MSPRTLPDSTSSLAWFLQFNALLNANHLSEWTGCFLNGTNTDEVTKEPQVVTKDPGECGIEVRNKKL